MTLDRRHFAATLLAAGTSAALPGCSAAPGPATALPLAQGRRPVERHGRLGVRGGRITGAAGTPVALRGMSLFWSQWAPQFYSAETVAWLARDWRVDVVRAAIAAEGEDSARQHFDRELAKAATVIEAAIREGIYVIVDWHAHRAWPNEAERFLSTVARRYAGVPNVLYEPWNEPLRDGVDWSRDVKPYHERMIRAIRAQDPTALVICGSPSWSQDVDIAAKDPLRFDNVAYTLHYYAGTHKQELRDKADAALAAGLALFVTEFGVVDATGDGPIAREESERWWDWAEARGISWLAWSVGDKAESSAALKPGTAPAGWQAVDLTESGMMLRSQLVRSAAAG